MTPVYRVLIDLDALESIRRSGQRRALIVNAIRDLSNDADIDGDFEVTDPEASRQFQVSCLAGFAITGWIDYPVQEVKVIDVRTVFRS